MSRKSAPKDSPIPTEMSPPGHVSPANGGIPIGLELATSARDLDRREGVAGEDLLRRYWELGRLVEELVGNQARRPGSRAWRSRWASR